MKGHIQNGKSVGSDETCTVLGRTAEKKRLDKELEKRVRDDWFIHFRVEFQMREEVFRKGSEVINRQ